MKNEENLIYSDTSLNIQIMLLSVTEVMNLAFLVNQPPLHKHTYSTTWRHAHLIRRHGMFHRRVLSAIQYMRIVTIRVRGTISLHSTTFSFFVHWHESNVDTD